MTCTGCPAMGVFTKLLIEPGRAGESGYTWDADSERYEILDNGGENIRKYGRIIGGQGITGKFYRLQSRKRQGGHFVYGRVTLNPSPGYLETLLPYMLGPKATEGELDGRFVPAGCLEYFGALLSRDLNNPWEYQDGVIAGWELSGSGIAFRETGTPDLLRLDLDMIFADESREATWPSTEPALPTGLEFAPYMFQDSEAAFIVGDDAREVYGFRLRYSNELSIRYANSLRISSACSTGRELKLWLELPWNDDNEDLYDQSHEGLAGSLTFAYGGHSTAFHFTNLTTPPESPYTRSKAEIYFETNSEGYGDEESDTPELTVENIIAEPTP